MVVNYYIGFIIIKLEVCILNICSVLSGKVGMVKFLLGWN